MTGLTLHKFYPPNRLLEKTQYTASLSNPSGGHNLAALQKMNGHKGQLLMANVYVPFPAACLAIFGRGCGSNKNL